MAKLETITVREISDRLAERGVLCDLINEQGLTRRTSRALVDALIEEIVRCVAEGKRVNLGIIRVEPKFRPAKPRRTMRRPTDGEPIEVAAQPAQLRVRTIATKRFHEELPSLRTKKGKEIAATLGNGSAES